MRRRQLKWLWRRLNAAADLAQFDSIEGEGEAG
jgi:hypothetical protein